MTTENCILDHVAEGRFTEAVSAWQAFATEKGYFGCDQDAPWGLSARLLEARLIYLSMFKHDIVFQGFVDHYRAWLLQQATHISTPVKLSTERIELPDSMRVGHEIIDRDHETLFSHANDIREALRQGDHRLAATRANDLIDEILDHFKREEWVLFNAGYPDAELHSQYHTVLETKAEDIRAVLLSLLSDEPQAVFTFNTLISFLVNDPIAADMDFKAFFQGKVVEGTASVTAVHGREPGPVLALE